MKIALTGGAGFIGSHLTKAYLDAGHDVFVIDNLAHGERHAVDTRARFYEMDIRDQRLRTLLQHERPDILSHHVAHFEEQSGMPDEPMLADADVHVRGLLHVLDCCVQASVSKCIYASSGNTLYEHTQINQLTEDAALFPQRPHDISTLAGEFYVRFYTRRFGLRHTILRYADVYGDASALRNEHPIHYFLRTLLLKQRPVIRGASNEARDHIFIDDVVRANLCALERGNNQTFNISSGCGYTVDQLYEMVASYLESDITPTHISGKLVEGCNSVLDNTRAQRLLGWQPEVSISEGIWRTGTSLRKPAPQATRPAAITEPLVAHKLSTSPLKATAR